MGAITVHTQKLFLPLFSGINSKRFRDHMNCQGSNLGQLHVMKYSTHHLLLAPVPIDNSSRELGAEVLCPKRNRAFSLDAAEFCFFAQQNSPLGKYLRCESSVLALNFLWGLTKGS